MPVARKRYQYGRGERGSRAKGARIDETPRLGDRWPRSDDRAATEPARASPARPANSHALAETKGGIEIRGVSTSHPPADSTVAITATSIVAWIQSRERAPDAAVVTDAAMKRANSG